MVFALLACSGSALPPDLADRWWMLADRDVRAYLATDGALWFDATAPPAELLEDNTRVGTWDQRGDRLRLDVEGHKVTLAVHPAGYGCYRLSSLLMSDTACPYERPEEL